MIEEPKNLNNDEVVQFWDTQLYFRLLDLVKYANEAKNSSNEYKTVMQLLGKAFIAAEEAKNAAYELELTIAENSRT